MPSADARSGKLCACHPVIVNKMLRMGHQHTHRIIRGAHSFPLVTYSMLGARGNACSRGHSQVVLEFQGQVETHSLNAGFAAAAAM